ncbi:hypothetical protein E5K00_08135 [Hymenobacter aquaticus]|uniref:Uncharacterized protein n=1 Tax=Hymenobacter aquaticus TaxID=1867101 RepID=A0A4Z0Q7M1_9BACT|nr:hypothetical protein [Hymenobacter aquaticus]TGE25153.1 hypothetical protein E5K00_08135 [Hymenobacter aquaticus]
MADKILPLLPPLLTPDDFRTATLAWIQTIEQPTATWYQMFEVGGSPLTAVSFPMETIMALLSTVRAYYIEARFMVINGQFSIGLYATDINHVRLSAYFPAYSWWTMPVTGEVAHSFTGVDQTPYALVQAWTTAWAQVPPPNLKTEMFATSYGTLEGYSFKAADFMQPLYEAQDMTGMDIRVDLGLHGYYPAVTSGNSALQYTFGLVLRLSLPQPVAEQAIPMQLMASIGSKSAFFDLSTPCPPGT